MEAFIHRENLALYRKKLTEAKDDVSRGTIQKLLNAEIARDFREEMPGSKRIE